ncbi:hypothetical protein PO124_03520 [Bacillus licheniformis]|nr:hypothetical protein [Bacillus licheniformis]
MDVSRPLKELFPLQIERIEGSFVKGADVQPFERVFDMASSRCRSEPIWLFLKRIAD